MKVLVLDTNDRVGRRSKDVQVEIARYIEFNTEHSVDVVNLENVVGRKTEMYYDLDIKPFDKAILVVSAHYSFPPAAFFRWVDSVRQQEWHALHRKPIQMIVVGIDPVSDEPAVHARRKLERALDYAGFEACIESKHIKHSIYGDVRHVTDRCLMFLNKRCKNE